MNHTFPKLKTADHDALVIRGGRVVDPTNNRDEIADVMIANGIIAQVAPDDAAVIDATGWIVCPGLMDLHVHLREPGQTHKETIETGTAAAAAGGFTFVACMPNTRPPLDHPDRIRAVLDRTARVGHCNVGPVAALTRDRAGDELADLATLQEAGAVAFSDDGDGLENDAIMLAAFEQAGRLDAVIIQHCEYKRISAGGAMHLGEISRRLKMPGLDPRSEEAMIQRDIELCRQSGARYHVAHISTARAVELVRRGKAEGLPVTAEVCTHHLVLTDEACAGLNPNTKMHPPLRSRMDVEGCRRGLLDGTIDCIVTDHAPHTTEDKAVGFLAAPPGIVGLETAVGIAASAMIESGLADWPQVIAWFTVAPAAVLGRRSRGIEVGAAADLTLLDPGAQWTVAPERFLSKGRNTPFCGWELKGRAIGTVLGRKVATIQETVLKSG